MNNVCKINGIDGREYTFRMEQVICVICEPPLLTQMGRQEFENQIVLPGVVFNVRPNDARAIQAAYIAFHKKES